MADKTREIPSLFEDFSDRSRLAVQKAEELAQQLGDKAVATGHLVYGLTLDRAGLAHHVFMDINIDPEMFSGYLAKLPREEASKDGGQWHRHLLQVFERARQVKKALGSNVVTNEHVLIALMSIREGTCFDILKEFAVEPDDIRIECLEGLGYEDEECPKW
jgi:ATP-dependent Clp protease ATP-binding subunit ClpC